MSANMIVPHTIICGVITHARDVSKLRYAQDSVVIAKVFRAINMMDLIVIVLEKEEKRMMMSCSCSLRTNRRAKSRAGVYRPPGPINHHSSLHVEWTASVFKRFQGDDVITRPFENALNCLLVSVV